MKIRRFLSACGVVLAICVSGCEWGADFDAEVVKISFEPSDVRVNDKLRFDYTVGNAGDRLIPQGTYEVELVVDGEVVAFDRDTSSIEPDCHVRYYISEDAFHWIAPRKGVFTYEVRILTSLFHDDLNPENNVMWGTVTVK